MSISKRAGRPRARWLVLLLAALLLVSCGGGDEYAADYDQPAADQQSLDQQSVDDESDWYYAETPEDCFEGEEFDPVDELCYLVVE